MAICPHCQTRTETVLTPCPSGDGYFTVSEEDYHSCRDEALLGWPVGGRFVVTSMLGEGSMARVFKAHQLNVERDVAIKVFEAERLAQDMSSTNLEENLEHARERFAQEAKVLAKLSHPNCVTLYDYGVEPNGSYIYIAMEHVSGLSLRKAINRGLKGEAIVEITQQILLALREAHALGIVHRDLKPENIILTLRFSTEEQLIKVVDFGIAKMVGPQDLNRTKVGTLFGTPAYMSPEQCRGETNDIGPQSDIYSLGCILYEMVCGQMPFDERTPQGMVHAHTTKDIPPVVPRVGLHLPEGFVEIVEKCLRKQPSARFENGQAALVALNNLLANGEGVATSTSEMMRLRASQANPSPTRVVVPQNQIRGDEIDAPMTEGQRLPEAVVPRLVQRSADVSGEGVLDTHAGVAKGKDAHTGESEGISPVLKGLILFGFLAVLVSCVALFAYIYQAIMAT